MAATVYQVCQYGEIGRKDKIMYASARLQEKIRRNEEGMKLYDIYRPITATPFKQSDTYIEAEPCDALNPYVRCFWGSPRPYTEKDSPSAATLVIPDTCMDIICNVGYTENKVNGGFCGINDSYFWSQDEYQQGAEISTFAIRFYAWTAVLFSEESMNGVKNNFLDMESHFSWIKRELERLFRENIGISPKQLASLIRYQYVWRDMVSNLRFNIQDSVYRYGYTDQAHLLHDFKRYHGVTSAKAREFAAKNVAFLQENNSFVR